jgi:CRISPR-associated exonuclease Cas4
VSDDETGWVSLSEIEHWTYCPRQWAIIHLEQCFIDNDDTVRGQLRHRNVDRPGHEKRPGRDRRTALNVVSDKHKLRGRCDAVDRRGKDVI